MNEVIKKWQIFMAEWAKDTKNIVEVYGEKEFDEKFGDVTCPILYNGKDRCDDPDCIQIPLKSFISSLLATQKEGLKKKILAMKWTGDTKDIEELPDFSFVNEHNDTLDQVLALLEEK